MALSWMHEKGSYIHKGAISDMLLAETYFP